MKTVRVLPWTLALLLAFGLAGGSGAAPCEGCFALVVLPDTQGYTELRSQPEGAAHLDLITRWTCAHRSAWVEPSTGKEMPISMLIQLGDLVQTGDLDEGEDGTLDEWERVDAAFDRLDACPGGGSVPYLVTLGNHDLSRVNQYQTPSLGYEQFFGTGRWAPYQCSDPSNCDWAAAEWFIGGGDTILADSRNNADDRPGPPVDQPGRHRAAVIRTPQGQRLLFLGIEAGFDFPPPTHPSEGDDLSWLRGVLTDYPGVPTLLFHHALIGPLGGFPTEEGAGAGFGSDSIVSTEDIWDRVGAPDDQTLMTFNGHWTGYFDPETQTTVTAREYDELLQTNAGFDVFAFFRNYQGVRTRDSQDNACPQGYGGGWIVIAAFDPSAQQIRVRSYRVEDTDDDCTHDGDPASAADLEADWDLPESVVPYDFPDTRPASFDNCPEVHNPDQDDADGDGVGDACNDADDRDGDDYADALDNCPEDFNPLQDDVDGDELGDVCDPFPNDPDNDLAQCISDLGDCQIDLIGCDGDLTQCGTDLLGSQSALSLCTLDLGACDASRLLLEDDLMEAQATIVQLEEELADQDADGVLDSDDACPETPSSTAVDLAGCSISQFCARVDVSLPMSTDVCRRSDWQNDEPLEVVPGDCGISGGACVPLPELSVLSSHATGLGAILWLARSRTRRHGSNGSSVVLVGPGRFELPTS